MTNRRIGCIGAVLVISLIAIALIFAADGYLRPKWVERYGIAGDQLHVTDGFGRPLPDALVERIAAIGAVRGGWDIHSIDIPASGTRPWVELDGAEWHLGSGITDARGSIAEPPFDAACSGSQMVLGCRQNDALFAIVVYRRGYLTAVIKPGVNVQAYGTIRLESVEHNANAGWNRLQSIEELLEPPLEPTQLWRDTYRKSHVPDGRSLIGFCEDELDWLSSHSPDPSTKSEADRLNQALRHGDLTDGRPIATVLAPG